jgi:hypothetical protein
LIDNRVINKISQFWNKLVKSLMHIPSINSKFLCIIDRESPSLAAIISSYLNQSGSYLPVLEFPLVTASNRSRSAAEDEHTFSISRAQDFWIHAINMIGQVNPENIILGGLSTDQKSFLAIPDNYNQIEIEDIPAVDFMLFAFLEKPREKLPCKSGSVLQTLPLALREERILSIEEEAEAVVIDQKKGAGVIVIENDSSTTAVIAANFAASISADVYFIEGITRSNVRFIKEQISEWKNGVVNALDKLTYFIYPLVELIIFKNYQFGTFFTQGIPYSLPLENIIPFSYVNTHHDADFFILNNLLVPCDQIFGGALIFSPKFFDEEETQLVNLKMTNENYFSKILGDKDATTYEFEMNITEFPFELLHICSHGGEIEGNLLALEFVDSDGQSHLVEYESVLTFSPGFSTGLVAVTEKVFPKKFDGYQWKSPQFKAQHYPHKLFPEMYDAIYSNPRKSTIIKKGIIVTGSNSIKCSDSAYQCLFNSLAGNFHPIVFNNTCCSWLEVAESFLDAGTRGYIGTLWNIDNKNAVEFATTFYNQGFNLPVIETLHKAAQILRGTVDENIYMFWGLPITYLRHFNNPLTVRLNVIKRLLLNINQWNIVIQKFGTNKVTDSIKERINWIANELTKSFPMEEVLEVRSELSKGGNI